MDKTIPLRNTYCKPVPLSLNESLSMWVGRVYTANCVCVIVSFSACPPLPPTIHTSSSSQNMESNWKNGHHTLTKIECHSENSKGVYCLQYDEKKIVSGLRDNTIKVILYAAALAFACGEPNSFSDPDL